MELNREQVEESIGYINDVIENWSLWQTHHNKLTKSMKDVLTLITSQEQKIKELTAKTEVQDITISELRKLLEKAKHDADRYARKIKELTEERKDFEIRALRAENEATKYKDRYESAKQSHDMLSESYDHLEKTKDELIAERSRLAEENERLEKEVDRLSQVVLYHDSIKEMEVEEAKADTVRKMQERFALRYGTYTDKDLTPITEVFWVLDQIAKEMLEGGDG